MKEFVKKKAVIVMDSAGLPNYMTMFYMEPGTYEPGDLPCHSGVRVSTSLPTVALVR